MKTIRALTGSRKGPFSRRLRGLLVPFAFVLLAGCSYVPDYLNPVSWFSDDDESVKRSGHDGAIQVTTVAGVHTRSQATSVSSRLRTQSE